MSLKTFLHLQGTNPHDKLSSSDPSNVSNSIKKDIEQSFNRLISENKSFSDFEQSTHHFEGIINQFCNQIKNSKQQDTSRSSLTKCLNEHQKKYLDHFLQELVSQSHKTVASWTRTLKTAEKIKGEIEEKTQTFNSNVAHYKNDILKFYQEFQIPEEVKLLIDNTLHQEIFALQEQIKKVQNVFIKISPNAQKDDAKCLEENKFVSFFTNPFTTTDKKIKKLIEQVEGNIGQMQEFYKEAPKIEGPIKEIVELSKKIQGFGTRVDLFFRDYEQTMNKVQNLLKSSKYKDSLLDDFNQIQKNYESVMQQFKDIQAIGDLLERAHPGMGYKKLFLEIESDMQKEYISLLNFSDVTISYQKLIRALADKSLSSISKADLEKVANAPFGVDPLKFHLRCGLAFIHQHQFLQYFDDKKVLSYLTDLQRVFEVLPKLKIKDFEEALSLRDSIFAFKAVQTNLSHNLLQLVSSDDLNKITSPKIDLSPLIEIISKELTRRIEAHEANLQETSLKHYLAWLTPIIANCPRLRNSALNKLIDRALEVVERKPLPKVIASTPSLMILDNQTTRTEKILSDLEQSSKSIPQKPQQLVNTSCAKDKEEWEEISLNTESKKPNWWNFLMGFRFFRWVASLVS